MLVQIVVRWPDRQPNTIQWTNDHRKNRQVNRTIQKKYRWNYLFFHLRHTRKNNQEFEARTITNNIEWLKHLINGDMVRWNHMVSNSMQMCNCEQVTETRKSLNQRMSCELPNNTKTYFNNTNRAELMYCFITVCLLRAPYYNVDRSLILWQLSLYRASSIVYLYHLTQVLFLPTIKYGKSMIINSVMSLFFSRSLFWFASIRWSQWIPWGASYT